MLVEGDLMKICGLQKLTLLDYPEKVACTVFTDGCDFRCPFCHNKALVINSGENQTIDETEIFKFLEKRVGILDGVCITGGEPLLQQGIIEFIHKMKNMGFTVKLDTNGSSPTLLKKLCEEKLIDYVAMDIKNSIAEYPKTIGIENYDTQYIEESAEFLMSDIVPYEFRTTVVRELHSSQDFEQIADWLKNASRYYLQTFQDSENVIQPGLSGCSKTEMEVFSKILKKTMQSVELRGV